MTYRTSHNSLKFLNYIKLKNRSGTFLTPCISITMFNILFKKENVWKNCPFFFKHFANKFQRPTNLQLNIKGLTASKMNVFYYFSLQFEALIILLPRTDAEKLILSGFQLAGSSLSRKHGLAFVCPQATKVHGAFKKY